MQKNTFIRHGARLLMAVLMLVFLAPSTVMAAEDWEYPSKKPSTPFGGGNGKKDNPYIISTAQHLANLAYMVTKDRQTYKGKYFLMTRDIVLNDNVVDGVPNKESNGSIRYNKNADYFDALKRWQPIGMYGYVYDDDFEGIFDGGGHSVSGVYCRKPLETGDKAYFNIGLFGNCKYARISNLTIKDSFFSFITPDNASENYFQLGTLVGLCKQSTIDNCHADNCVISSDGDQYVESESAWRIGGLVGESEDDCNFYNCSYNGIVDVCTKYASEFLSIGGLIGVKDYVTGSSDKLVVEGCSTKGKLIFNTVKRNSGSYVYAGGLLGTIEESLTSSPNPKYIRLVRCVNRMDIEILADKTGTVAESAIHGIVCTSATCEECVNFGNITVAPKGQVMSTDVYVGGICKMGKAVDCFNYGKISAPRESELYEEWRAWIGPWISMSGTVTDCFAYNEISTGTPKYDILNSPKITYEDLCYYIKGRSKEYTLGCNGADDFKSLEFVAGLNQDVKRTKYGLIDDAADNFKGYLMLTSLGAQDKTLIGSGTEADPYLISNANDLRTLVYLFSVPDKDFKDKVFKLTNDIDMTNEPELACIGRSEYPESHFNGIFDGDGHSIRGLKAKNGYLFKFLTGTVKNLALDDFKSMRKDCFAGIAYTIGIKGEKGSIENCRVIGDADLSYNGYFDLFGGICGRMAEKGCTVRNCYYVGNVRLDLSGTSTKQEALELGGITTMVDKDCTVENCVAVFNYDTDSSAKDVKTILGGITTWASSDANVSNNFYHYEIAASAQKPMEEVTIEGTTAVTDERNISAATLGSAWVRGRCHPVLKDLYHYDCKDYEGNTVALDPAGCTPKNNEILTIVPTAEQKTDAKLWELPNLAVYSEDLDADIITSFNIIDGSGDNYSLRYKPTKEGVSVKGLVTYPWKVDRGYVNWRSFCLPGAVDKSNLPDGCKLYVGGTYDSASSRSAFDGGSMNIVEVESVPAGVPFFMRYDNKAAATDTVLITMTGDLVMQPQKAADNSSLVGTFKPVEGSYIHYIPNEETTDDGNTSIYMHSGSYVDCFRGYVVGNNGGNIELIDYLLLDEQSNATDDIIADNNGHSVKLKLRRSIKTGGWNTVCLPFDVSSDKITTILGTGTRIEELTNVSYDDATGSVVMTFSAVQGTGDETLIKAGKPYLVYPEKEASILDLGSLTIYGATTPTVFSNVNLGNDTRADISMVGSYGKAYLASTDGKNLYFIQQDKFYRATKANPVIMSGFRCYFAVTSKASTPSTPSQAFSSARIVHSDGSTTDIKLVDTGLGTGDTRIYDLQGIRHSEMQRGLNIVGGKKIVK